MENSIEKKIQISTVLIYLLLGLTCFGSIIYFFGIKKEIDAKKRSVEIYNRELNQISNLIFAVNDAQAEVNLYVATGSSNHIIRYQKKAKDINAKIDSLTQTAAKFEVDTLLSRIIPLLREKERSIILLNNQFHKHKSIDELSNKITSLSVKVKNNALDSVKRRALEMSEERPKKGLIKRIGDAFSNKKDNELERIVKSSVAHDSNRVTQNDTSIINNLVDETKGDYLSHISTIGKRVQQMLQADQYITFQITELLTQLYNQIIQMRMDEINKDELAVQKNNRYALYAAGAAMLSVLICSIWILRNVNKGYRARKALAEANLQNQQLIESRQRLMLSVSHDVKTPLNAILGYTDLYNREGKLSTTDISPIKHSGNHILALLNNLLEFSSLEKGTLSLIEHYFRLTQLCDELEEMFLPLARQKSLLLVLNRSFESEIIIRSDYLKIKQILSNILSNGIKYTQQGSVSLDIEYRSGKIVFTLLDTGVGIPPEKRGKLFMPFSRIKENSAWAEGSGFGLFVVKGLVDLFRGGIDIRSELNKGTQVKIWIPVKEGTPAEDTSIKKILIVDDEPLFLNMLAQYGNQLGHTTEICGSLSEFEKKLEHLSGFDFVLTDMEMLHFSGIDVLQKARQKDNNLPVILISGRSDITKEDVLKRGFSDFLQKPVTLHSLFLAIGGNPPTHKAEMLDELDQKALAQIADAFIMSTVNHLIVLRKSLDAQDFDSVRFTCHKMLPSMTQMHAPQTITDTLHRIDNMRGENKPVDPAQLLSEIEDLLPSIEKFLEEIQDKYEEDEA